MRKSIKIPKDTQDVVSGDECSLRVIVILYKSLPKLVLSEIEKVLKECKGVSVAMSH